MRGVSMGHTQVRACCFIRGATRAKAVLGRHFVSLHYQVAGSATGGGNLYNINYTRLFRNLPWAGRLLTIALMFVLLNVGGYCRIHATIHDFGL
jgi:hypothetical protein